MLMIHTADLHLGASPDGNEPWGKNRKQELWDSFQRLLNKVKEEKADILLIAGDLFHRPPLLRELREVNSMFAELEKTRVVLMAGNHDFISEHSFYHKFSWAENVFFFSEDRITKVSFPELKTDVYGMSYCSKEICERVYDEVRPENNGYYHILLAHGGDEKHIPYTKEKLEKNGFDYIAFGHIHKPGMILTDRAVMAGSLEPTDHTCSGIHGYVQIEAVQGHNRIMLVPFAKREYRKLEIPLTEEDTMHSLQKRVTETIAEQGKDHIYDVVLTGKRHAAMEIMKEQLKAAGNIRDIADQTEPLFDYEYLKTEYRGSLLERYLVSFDDCTEELMKKARGLGTAAIMEAMGL